MLHRRVTCGKGRYVVPCAARTCDEVRVTSDHARDKRGQALCIRNGINIFSRPFPFFRVEAKSCEARRVGGRPIFHRVAAGVRETEFMECVIRGELFRAGRDDSKYKVRWFELTKKGDLTWGEGEVAALKASMPMLGCQIVLEKGERVGKSESETRFGFSVSAPGVGGRPLRLQASSLEERQLWVDALEKAAHPDAQRSTLFSGGRVLTLVKQTNKAPLGLELANSTDYMGVGAPGVVVTAVDGPAAEAGLLVGDMILMLGATVLRNREVAPHTLALARDRVGRDPHLTLTCSHPHPKPSPTPPPRARPIPHPAPRSRCAPYLPVSPCTSPGRAAHRRQRPGWSAHEPARGRP